MSDTFLLRKRLNEELEQLLRERLTEDSERCLSKQMDVEN